MIRTWLITILYMVNGALVTTLWTCLLVSIWGHRHGMSLSEVAIDTVNKGKFTFQDLLYLIIGIIFWPVFVVFVAYGLLYNTDELMTEFDKEFGDAN